MVEDYLLNCIDKVLSYHKTAGEKSDTYERHIKVKIPTREGLALHLDVDLATLDDWRKKHPEFDRVYKKVMLSQAEALIRGGLSGDYNSTIAKLVLSKHGYRESVDITSDGKELPAPIMRVDRTLPAPETAQVYTLSPSDYKVSTPSEVIDVKS